MRDVRNRVANFGKSRLNGPVTRNCFNKHLVRAYPSLIPAQLLINYKLFLRLAMSREPLYLIQTTLEMPVNSRRDRDRFRDHFAMKIHRDVPSRLIITKYGSLPYSQIITHQATKKFTIAQFSTCSVAAYLICDLTQLARRNRRRNLGPINPGAYSYYTNDQTRRCHPCYGPSGH
jgi:hypothetical protein